MPLGNRRLAIPKQHKSDDSKLDRLRRTTSSTNEAKYDWTDFDNDYSLEINHSYITPGLPEATTSKISNGLGVTAAHPDEGYTDQIIVPWTLYFAEAVRIV